jgi:accessory gene regulator protein AgrB
MGFEIIVTVIGKLAIIYYVLLVVGEIAGRNRK